jgi:hypothetical protein
LITEAATTRTALSQTENCKLVVSFFVIQANTFTGIKDRDLLLVVLVAYVKAALTLRSRTMTVKMEMRSSGSHSQHFSMIITRELVIMS